MTCCMLSSNGRADISCTWEVRAESSRPLAQDSGWEPVQRSARLGKRQASIPAEDIDTLRGRSSIDMAGASSSSTATGGFGNGVDDAGATSVAYRYGAADGGYTADYGDSSNSTRYGDGNGGGVSDQLGGSPAMPVYQTSLQLPRSPLDFGSIGAEAGRLHAAPSGRQRKRATTSDAYAAAAVAIAAPTTGDAYAAATAAAHDDAASIAPQDSTGKTNAALAAYLATQLDPQRWACFRLILSFVCPRPSTTKSDVLSCRCKGSMGNKCCAHAMRRPPSAVTGKGRHTAGDLASRLRRATADPTNSALQHGASLQQRSFAMADAELSGSASSSAVNGHVGIRNPFAAAAAAASGLGGSGGDAEHSGAADAVGSALRLAGQLQAAADGASAPSAPGVHSSHGGVSAAFAPGVQSGRGGVSAASAFGVQSGRGFVEARSILADEPRIVRRNLFADVAAAAAAKAAQRHARVAAAGSQPREQQSTGAGNGAAGSDTAMADDPAELAAFDIGASGGSRRHNGSWKPADADAAAGAAADAARAVDAVFSSRHTGSAAGLDSDAEPGEDAQQLLESGRRRRGRPPGARWKPHSPEDSPERATSSGGASSIPAAAAAAGNGRYHSSGSASGSTRGSSSGGSDAGSLQRSGNGSKWRPHDQLQPAGVPAASLTAAAVHSDAEAEAAAVRQAMPAGRAVARSAPKHTLQHDAASVLPDDAHGSSSASGSRPASRDTQSHVESWLQGIGSPESRGRQPSSFDASGSIPGGGMLAAAGASPGADHSVAFGSSMEELSALAVTAAAGSPLVQGALRQSTPGELAAHRIDIDDSEVRDCNDSP